MWYDGNISELQYDNDGKVDRIRHNKPGLQRRYITPGGEFSNNTIIKAFTILAPCDALTQKTRGKWSESGNPTDVCFKNDLGTCGMLNLNAM